MCFLGTLGACSGFSTTLAFGPEKEYLRMVVVAGIRLDAWKSLVNEHLAWLFATHPEQGLRHVVSERATCMSGVPSQVGRTFWPPELLQLGGGRSLSGKKEPLAPVRRPVSTGVSGGRVR